MYAIGTLTKTVVGFNRIIVTAQREYRRMRFRHVNARLCGQLRTAARERLIQALTVCALDAQEKVCPQQEAAVTCAVAGKWYRSWMAEASRSACGLAVQRKACFSLGSLGRLRFPELRSKSTFFFFFF